MLSVVEWADTWQSFSPLVALISAFIHNFDIYIDIILVYYNGGEL